MIQTLYAAPLIIASLIDLFCIQDHGRGHLDSRALPLERDRLLDLLHGQVGPILHAHFHVSIRITAGTELVDVLRTQPRPVNAWDHPDMLDWNREEAMFLIGIGTPPDIGRLVFVAAAETVGDDRKAANFVIGPQNAHLYIQNSHGEIYTCCSSKKKTVENSMRPALEAERLNFLAAQGREPRFS